MFCLFMMAMIFLYGNEGINGEIHQAEEVNDGGKVENP